MDSADRRVESTRTILQTADEVSVRFALGYELGRTGSPMLGKGSFGHSGREGIWRTPILKAVLRWAMIATTWHGYLAGPDARWLPWTKALHQAIARKTSRVKTESVAGH